MCDTPISSCPCLLDVNALPCLMVILWMFVCSFLLENVVNLNLVFLILKRDFRSTWQKRRVAVHKGVGLEGYKWLQT